MLDRLHVPSTNGKCSAYERSVCNVPGCLCHFDLSSHPDRWNKYVLPFLLSLLAPYFACFPCPLYFFCWNLYWFMVVCSLGSWLPSQMLFDKRDLVWMIFLLSSSLNDTIHFASQISKTSNPPTGQIPTLHVGQRGRSRSDMAH